MKQETIYLKIEQNTLVHDHRVKLMDIAKMECTDESVLRQLKQKKVYSFPQEKGEKKNKKQHQVFSILKIIELIHEDYPNADVQNMGEKDFVVEYDPTTKENKVAQNIKTAVMCVLIFFGSAFTIMAFNNDVSVGDVFEKFYMQVMGVESDGVTELEIFYCIGLPLGILAFFNHAGKKKLTPDPTPIQVQMRKYEKDVDTTFIEEAGRDGSTVDVD